MCSTQFLISWNCWTLQSGWSSNRMIWIIVSAEVNRTHCLYKFVEDYNPSDSKRLKLMDNIVNKVQFEKCFCRLSIGIPGKPWLQHPCRTRSGPSDSHSLPPSPSEGICWTPSYAPGVLRLSWRWFFYHFRYYKLQTFPMYSGFGDGTVTHLVTSLNAYLSISLSPYRINQSTV